MQNLKLGTTTHSHTGIYANCVAAGLPWGRLDFTWNMIEASKGTYTFSTWDTIVDEAVGVGANILAIISYCAAWANGSAGDKVPPTNYQDYFDYCTALVNHFSPMGVKYWEIWNEPNISTFWKDSANSGGPRAENYALLLKGAYQAIKAADPSATVIVGGLTVNTTTEDSTTHISPNIFLQRIYDTIGAGYFDAMNYHPYGWTQSTLDALYQVMVANGDSDKKIWLTEYGAWDGTASGAISEFDQMQLIQNGYKWAKWLPYVDAFFVYDLIDDGNDPTNSEDNYGLIRADGTYKPAYAQLKLLS